jgi:hypothetical protein
MTDPTTSPPSGSRETAASIASGICDDGMTPYVSGVNCIDCGRFVGRDGSIEIDFEEMSSTVASVEGTCRCCIDRTWNAEVDAERRHLAELTS